MLKKASKLAFYLAIMFILCYWYYQKTGFSFMVGLALLKIEFARPNKCTQNQYTDCWNSLNKPLPIACNELDDI